MVKINVKLIVVSAILVVSVFGMTLSVYAAGSGTKESDKSNVELGPLRIVLPKPLFIGTPKNIRSDNLEPQTGRKRPPFMAPKGATNVAINMEVSGSDEEPIIGEMELLTDGDKDGVDGSFVEFGPGVQHVQIDLGKVCEIYAIVFWHYHAEARVYKDIVVRIADDTDFVKNVRTLFNNDHNNTSGLGVGKDREYIETNDGKLVDAKNEKARYVRLYSNGSTANEMNHYIEVEVYGKPAA